TSVRLAVLNCCLGDFPSPKRNLSGLGPLLMQAGVPAVVAMRYEIPDTVAIRFSKVFYRALLDPKEPGRVDLAMEQARQSLFLNGRDGSLRGFITPVLHLAGGCEHLFHLQPAPEVAPPTVPESSRPERAGASLLPAELVEALREGRCVPEIGRAHV